MQSIIDKTDFTNFLQSGALLQISSDRFKLIWGPFQQGTIDFNNLSDQKTAVYKPDFWDFTLQSPPEFDAYFGLKEVVVSRDELILICRSLPAENSHIQWRPVNEDQFKEQFAWSSEKFVSGELHKTVPIVMQSGLTRFNGLNLAAALLEVIQGKHYGTTYGYWENKVGFLGHSPEIVVEWDYEQQTLRTMALAGTTKADERDLLLTDKKIQREHQIVVDDIVQAFKKVDTKPIEVNATQVLSLKHLNHLLTPIEIKQVNAPTLAKYLAKIHPTAALGLFPRIEKYFDENKTFPIQKIRKQFAAPFGFINSKQIKVTAAIRCFNFSPSVIEIFSGCGVTNESNMDCELDELNTKRNSVKKMMGFNL